MKKISFAFIFIFVITQYTFSTTYYAQGNSNPNVLANWNTIPAGGGTSPADFTTGTNDIFEIQAGHTMTLTGSSWTISGTGLCQVDSGATLICSSSFFTTGLTVANGGFLTATSTVGVNNGQTGFDFIINGIYKNSASTAYGSGATGTCTSTGKFQLASTTAAGTVPVLTWDPASTIEIMGYTSFTGNMAWGNQTFGNVIWNCPSQTGTPNANSTLRTIRGDLTITNTGTGSFRLFANTAATLNISGNLKIDAGTFAFVSGSSVSTVNVTGNVTVNGGTLKIGTATTQTNVAKLSVAGNLLINGGTIDFKDANAVTGANIFEVGGNLSLTTGTLTQTGSTSGTEGSLRFIDTTTWSSGGTFTNNYINTTVNANSLLTLNNDYPEAASRTLTVNGVLNGGASSVTGAGNFLLAATGTLKSGNDLGIDGSIAVSGTKTFTSGAGYEFSGTSVQSTGTTLPAAITGALTFSNTGGVVTLSQSTSNTGTTTVSPAAIVDIANFDMTGSGGASVLTGSGKIRLSGDLSTQITGYNTNTFSGTYEFSGSQTVPAGTYTGITVNGPGITIGGDVVISGLLTLTNGNITLGTNNITANGTSGGSALSYVVTDGTGSLFVNNVGNTDVLFPVGRTTYSPVTINNLGTADNYSVNVQNTITNPTFNDENAVQKQWNITELIPGGSDVILTMQWTTADEGTLFDRNSSALHLGHWNGTAYEPYSATLGGSAGTWTATATNKNSFSPFIVGDDAALPVELSSFTSNVNLNNVKLSWSTISELNNSGFEIERKSESSAWTKINNIAGNGTSNIVHNYSYEDKNLTEGKYNYRLKQIDFNGNFKYYSLFNEVIIGAPKNFALSQNYPNPFNPSTIIKYELPLEAFVTLKVYDMIGKEVANLVSESKASGYYTVKFDASKLSSGIYFYKLQAGDFVAVKKLMLVK
ncbi:MAG: T9SS type A sorting domain-containing protein [Bacteroidetes bacterium]|nr:T9SS type A sorting domain-containing protein [Bacteroidota bacterium]